MSNGSQKPYSERLLYREFVTDDNLKLFELDSNPRVHRFLGRKPVTTLSECDAIISNIQDQYRTNGIGRMAVVLKETGEFIGWAGLKLQDHVNGHARYYDLGYRFIEKHWGKGYATDASKAFVEYGFNVLNLNIINAFADADNIASRKALEKAGLRFVENFVYEGDDSVWYEIRTGTGVRAGG